MINYENCNKHKNQVFGRVRQLTPHSNSMGEKGMIMCKRMNNRSA